MKIFRASFLIVLCAIVNQNCSNFDGCHDEELGFPRVDNLSNKLKTGGYYYGDLSGVNPDSPNIYVLNQNGVFLNMNSFEQSDALSGNVNLGVSDLQKKHKGFWGIYKIEGVQIEIQSWTPNANGCVSVLTEKGIILNDSTFKITTWEGSKDKKIHAVDALFKFVSFSPKPDSIVSFIP